MIAFVEIVKALLFIAVVGWLFFNLGRALPRKRRLTLQAINAERDRISEFSSQCNTSHN